MTGLLAGPLAPAGGDVETAGLQSWLGLMGLSDADAGLGTLARLLGGDAASGDLLLEWRQALEACDWVDAYESSYARTMRKPGFLRDHARLLNAATRLALELQERGEPWAVRCGLPSRAELARMVDELQALRRRARDAGDVD